MASTQASNGSYLQNADPQNFPANPTAAPSTYQPMGTTTPQSQQQQTSSSSSADLPKDEVGWYFVEQYYTTLNKTPDRLHVSILLCVFPTKSSHVLSALLQQEVFLRLGN